MDSVYVDVDLSVPSPEDNQLASSSHTVQEEKVLPREFLASCFVSSSFVHEFSVFFFNFRSYAYISFFF